MRKITLSVTAALLMGASAFAVDTKIENVKVEGAAGLYYSTTDAGATGSHFDQPTSIADAFFTLKVTADLNKNIKSGLSATTVSTLGLENNLVANTFSNAHPGVVTDFTVVTEAWLEIAAGKSTTATLGRQKLDTPLVFSQEWNVLPNTYEAAVIANKSIENLILIGAYVGRGNGGLGHDLDSSGTGDGGVLAVDGAFGNFGADSNTSKNAGAYALGAVYNTGDLTVQAWGYNVSTAATNKGVNALWAEVELAPASGLGFGAQYTSTSFKDETTATAADNDASAVKIAMTKKDAYKVAFAYSTTGTNTSGTGAGFNVGGGAQSKLYTETQWNFGYVTREDTTAVNLTAEYTIAKGLDAGLYVTQTDRSTTGVAEDMSEVTVRLSKDYEGMKATLALIQTDAEDQNFVNATATAYTTIQVYLDASF